MAAIKATKKTFLRRPMYFLCGGKAVSSLASSESLVDTRDLVAPSAP